MAFYDRLKEARLNAELTQEQLAGKLGIAKSTLSGYESGNREPTVATIAKVLKILNIDANYLYQDEMDTFKNNPVKLICSEMKHLEKYRRLDNYGKELIDMVLDKELQRMKSEQTEHPVASDGYRIINYYERLASANIPVDMIEIPNIPKYKNVKYAIGVNGHSMEPEYFEGDKLLVEPTDTIECGEIGIFILEGDTFVKKRGANELISINDNYENIPLTPNTECIGRVIDKISALDTLSEDDLNTLKNGFNIENKSSFA